MAERDLVLGLDYGTDSARALLVNAETGETLGTAVAPYRRWAERRWCDPDRDQYRQHPQDYIDALLETGPKTDLLIMASPVWPEIGDTLGLTLEEVFSGTRDDVQAALDEAAFFAEDSLMRLK